MAQRHGVHTITPNTAAWTCKIQVVDKYGPRESKDKRLKYVNMIFEDEHEDQVKAIIYGDDIPLLHDKFDVFHTYLVTGARLQKSYLKYERPLHKFEWVIDRKTIIDSINEDTPDETVLPPPKKLTLASFKDVKNYHDTNAEFGITTLIYFPTFISPINIFSYTFTLYEFFSLDILAIVINCFQPKHVASGRRLQELIVLDTHKKSFTFTIWEDPIIEDEGKKIMNQLEQQPVILARRVTVSKFNGTSLTTKFNTSILIDPPYPQCEKLQAWAIENKQLLDSFTVRSTSKSGTLISLPVDDEIVPIADVQSIRDVRVYYVYKFIKQFGCCYNRFYLITLKHGHTFTIETKFLISNEVRNYFVLVCSNCGQEMRSPIRRRFDCVTCNEKTMLIPRCRFEVELQDASGKITGTIVGKEAEKVLTYTAEQIYEITKIKNDSLPIKDVQSQLAHKWFSIQAKKIVWKALHSVMYGSGKGC